MICQYCGNAATYQFKNGIHCCSSHFTKCPAQQKLRHIARTQKSTFEKAKSIAKNKFTKLLRYGDPNFNNRAAAKETTLKKYGEDNVSKVNYIKLKKDATFDENFRQNLEEHTKLIYRKQETWKKKDMEIINQKRVDTCLAKYGVSNPLQVLEIFEKTQKIRWKLFTFPSGKIERVQGSEHFAIEKLLENYLEEDIVVNRKLIPDIWYFFGGSKRRYYPDIYILSENKIIEVKSTWTFTKDLEKNQAKKQECISQGFKFEFWVHNGKTFEIVF